MTHDIFEVRGTLDDVAIQLHDQSIAAPANIAAQARMMKAIAPAILGWLADERMRTNTTAHLRHLMTAIETLPVQAISIALQQICGSAAGGAQAMSDMQDIVRARYVEHVAKLRLLGHEGAQQ